MGDLTRTIDPVDEWIGRHFPDWSRWPETWRARLMDVGDALRVEERLDGDTLVIRAEMPGIDPDRDVDISVSDHTLHLRAHREQRREAEARGRVHSEFRYGSFSRSIPLPDGAGEEAVEASYRDGILEVRIPVTEASSEVRHITVRRD